MKKGEKIISIALVIIASLLIGFYMRFQFTQRKRWGDRNWIPTLEELQQLHPLTKPIETQER